MSAPSRLLADAAGRGWRATLAARLATRPATGGHGARPTASDDAEAGPAHPAPIPAAVLVPIVLHPAPTILLTRRTAHLAAHAGQVSFPGGRIEPDDADAAAAAFREAEEEVGLPRAAVEHLATLPMHLTGTGYAITPVVGLVTPPFLLAPDPGEVAEAFEIPLARVLDPAGPYEAEAEFRGRMRRFWVIPDERHHIWGATAAILVNLARVLRGEPG